MMLLEEVAATPRQRGISLLAPIFILDMASVWHHSHGRGIDRCHMISL